MDNIDFNGIDWSALLGISYQRCPVLLNILPPKDRTEYAHKIIFDILDMEKVPKNYARNLLDCEVEQQHMSNFDKACIVYEVNKTLKELDSQ